MHVYSKGYRVQLGLTPREVSKELQPNPYNRLVHHSLRFTTLLNGGSSLHRKEEGKLQEVGVDAGSCIKGEMIFGVLSKEQVLAEIQSRVCHPANNVPPS